MKLLSKQRNIVEGYSKGYKEQEVERGKILQNDLLHKSQIHINVTDSTVVMQGL